MITIKAELDFDAEGFIQYLETAKSSAISATIKPLSEFLMDKAEERLDNSKELWKSGFKMESIGEDSYAIFLSGKLATMIEEGFQGSELKELLLNGVRAKHNAAKAAKDGVKSHSRYVDVPFGISARKMDSGKIENINISDFKDVDQVLAKFKQTKNKKVQRASAPTRSISTYNTRKEQVETYLESAGKGTKVGFMTIRRISDKTNLKGWSGAKILDSNVEIENVLSREFGMHFQRLMNDT